MIPLAFRWSFAHQGSCSPKVVYKEIHTDSHKIKSAIESRHWAQCAVFLF